MCLIIHAKDCDTIPEKFFDQVARVNNDGWGIVYPADGKINVIKGMAQKSLYKEYLRVHDEVGCRDIAIHMRYATHGAKNTAMCHPFMVHNSGVYMMHNGITSYPGNTVGAADPRSDTFLFAQRFIRPILNSVKNVNEFIRTPEFNALVNKEGQGHFLFSDYQGHVLIKPEKWKTTTFNATVSNNSYFNNEFDVYTPSSCGYYGGYC